MSKITYTDKVPLYENTDIADINKVKADDMNEIKNVVNANDDKFNYTQEELNEIKNVVNANDDKFNYTQEEQIIGTWIDGKPIYKKVIKVTSIDSANNNYDVAISISNLNEIVNIGGTIKIKGTKK